MTTGMFILRPDGSLTSMSNQPYDSEDLLQSWIADHPELLAGEQINPEDPRRWLLVRREAGVPGDQDSGNRWSLDHLFLDQDGIPTFVEVKRSSDTRIRREVVGQMLDYAANGLKYWPVESIKSMFVERCRTDGIDPELEIQRCLGDETSSDDLWIKVANNLEDGSIRLLFVADQIPMELLAVVEFLNKQMTRTEVLAIEVRQYIEASNGEIVTLVPRVLGQSVESQQKKRSSASGQRRWDEAGFLGQLADETYRAAMKQYPTARINNNRKTASIHPTLEDFFLPRTMGARPRGLSLLREVSLFDPPFCLAICSLRRLISSETGFDDRLVRAGSDTRVGPRAGVCCFSGGRVLGAWAAG